MLIPYNVGKNSDGSFQYIDLAKEELVLISWSVEKQLKRCVNRITGINCPYIDRYYLICSSRILKEINQDTHKSIVYIKDMPEASIVSSKYEFLYLIHTEIRTRQKLLRSQKVQNFMKYNTLESTNKDRLSYQFLIADNIWDLVITKPKLVALMLIDILLVGPSVGIHAILASGISYRNLAQQLIEINPVIEKKLQKITEKTTLNQPGLRATEIICTPDDLVFLKQKGYGDLTRYFP